MVKAYQPKIKGGMLAAVRIRSAVNAGPHVLVTMELLGLHRKHACSVLPDNPVTKGMYERVKDYVAYGNIDIPTFTKMLESRGKLEGDAPLDPKKLGFSSAEDVAKSIAENGKKPEGLKRIFRLHPPTKGFRKSIKRHYPKGALGDWGPKINELLVRMI